MFVEELQLLLPAILAQLEASFRLGIVCRPIGQTLEETIEIGKVSLSSKHTGAFRQLFGVGPQLRNFRVFHGPESLDWVVDISPSTCLLITPRADAEDFQGLGHLVVILEVLVRIKGLGVCLGSFFLIKPRHLLVLFEGTEDVILTPVYQRQNLDESHHESSHYAVECSTPPCHSRGLLSSR